MKEIPLAGRLGAGMVAMVDDADFEWLSQFRWTATEGGFRQTMEDGKQIRRGTFYAVRSAISTRPDGTMGRGSRAMQSDILYPGERCPKGFKADHEDGDGLNNQRHNLRLVNNSISNLNRRLSPTRNTSGYRGISFDKTTGCWNVTLSAEGERHHRKGYKTPERAAAVYNSMARHLYGEHAQFNIMPDGLPHFFEKAVRRLNHDIAPPQGPLWATVRRLWYDTTHDKFGTGP